MHGKGEDQICNKNERHLVVEHLDCSTSRTQTRLGLNPIKISHRLLLLGRELETESEFSLSMGTFAPA